jgi:NADH dehydrogenase (ubiquinone) Fe-S protein 6
MQGNRFEQSDMSMQPKPQPAIDLIAQQPIQKVEKRVVSCDGGGLFTSQFLSLVLV